MGQQVGEDAVRAVIIGSGFAGLGAAIRLKEAGCDDLVILERDASVGGTWRDNTYPGAACDIPAHLYSFSFAPKADWSTVYPRQPEIRSYLERMTDRFGLRKHLRFHAEVTRARFDEPRARWEISTSDGRTFEGEALILAVGPLSDPKLPDIPGRGDFAGPSFHSAEWDHDVDLTGKRVGVIGTGASAIQFVPRVAEDAARLTVFQRSAPWIIPRIDRSYSDVEKAAFRWVPGLRRLYRWLIYLQKEARFIGFASQGRLMHLAERFARRHMENQVSDPALRRKLTPDYRMGCKRILISSDYYPALSQDHVDVETTGIDRITSDGVRLQDGRDIALDVVIWGTGFDVADPLGPMSVQGLDGRELREVWSPYPIAHKGTTVPGFPNLFFLLGPNTGLGHNSMIYMMESQFNYLVDAIRRIGDPEVAYLDVRDDALEGFTREVSERNAQTVWSTGCRSWYLTDDGYNFSLWPGYTFEYRRRTRELDEDRYRIVTRRRTAA
ncbi:MAG: NAD(P)/FAD-dependent oxidoreductase [Actinobacteria bacterium]|nr:NAD(P)/FAD-dependent oxidoreductase [Actinomycetota bacterium]